MCETVALERRRAGLPALALAWGAVDDAGYVAEVLQARPGGAARAPKGAAAAVRIRWHWPHAAVQPTLEHREQAA